MKLLTSSLLKQFADVGCQCDKDDPLVIAKYFLPEGYWTWYATEYDPETGIFFGYVVGYFSEWGSFSLADLKSLRTKSLNLGIERDLHFEPTSFSKLKLPT